MFCEKCGQEVKEGAKFCDKCGAPIQQKEKKAMSKNMKIILGIMVGVLGICAVYCLSYGISWFWRYLFPPTDAKLIQEQYYRYYYKNGNQEREKEHYINYHYDEVGNLVQITRYSDENKGGFLWKEYSYDESGNLVQSILYYSDGDVRERIKSIYDEAGNLVTENYYNNDIYDMGDERNRLREKYTYVLSKYEEVRMKREQGIEIEYWQIEYSYEKGNLAKEITYAYYDEKYYMYGYTEYNYDNSGNLVKKTEHYDVNDESVATYSYDNSGNLVEESRVRGEKRNEITYSYDDSGNLVKESRDRGNLDIIYSYDKTGNLVAEERLSSSGSTMYIYSYDRAGNLVSEEYLMKNRSKSEYEKSSATVYIYK